MAIASPMAQANLPDFGRHGGRLDAAQRAYPNASTPWIDLSTGLNPNPWSGRSIAFDPAPLPTLSHLAGLEAAAARYFGTTPDRVAAVPGSETVLRLLPAIGLPAPIIVCRPSYGTHLEMADEIIEAARIGTTGGTMLLANPNNPDGRLRPVQDLRALADRQSEASGWLVVDEAFADTAPDGSIIPSLGTDTPVIVTRSFGKFFGLAGVRLGFLVAPPAILDRTRRLFGDWPVSVQAIAWGTAAYGDDAWIAAARVDLPRRAGALDTLLRRHGLHTLGGCPLFRLVEHSDAPAIFDRLAHAGILTRPFADRPDWLRFGLPGDDAALDRLDRALADG